MWSQTTFSNTWKIKLQVNATGVSTFNSKFIRMMIIDAQGLSNTTIKNTSFSPHMLRIFDIIHWRHNNNVDIMINIYYYSKNSAMRNNLNPVPTWSRKILQSRGISSKVFPVKRGWGGKITGKLITCNLRFGNVTLWPIWRKARPPPPRGWKFLRGRNSFPRQFD